MAEAVSDWMSEISHDSVDRTPEDKPTADITATEVPRRGSRRWRGRIAVAASILIVWAGLCSWSVWSSYQSSSDAASTARALAHDVLDIDRNILVDVGTDLDNAARRLDDPWLAPVRWTPWIGNQLDAVDQMAQAGSVALGAGVVALDAVDRTSVIDVGTSLSGAVDALTEARSLLAEITLPSDQWLVGPIAEARAELVTALSDVDSQLARYQALGAGFGGLMSGNSTYLVAAANTSEMGSANGMLLSYGTMTVADGAVLVSPFVAADTLSRPSGVDVSDQIRTLWSNLDPGHNWKYTSHLSSRASEVARLSADMWESAVGQPIDGVVIIDPVGMQNLMIGAGVDSVDVGGRRIAARQVATYLGHDQYDDYDNERQQRQSVIAPIASSALLAMFDTAVDTRQLASAILESLDTRHLFLWSRSTELRAWWEQAGATGDPSASSVKIALANAGGNKLDQFVAIDASVKRADRRISVDVIVTNTFTGPEVPVVAGDNPGHYTGYLVVSIPGDARSVETMGSVGLNAAAADGETHSLVALVELAPSDTATFRIDFTAPHNTNHIRIEASGRWPSITLNVDGDRHPDRAFTIHLNS